MAEEIIAKEWVKQTNIGDEIAYVKGYERDYYIISKVVGKTTTGSLKTDDDDLIKLDGYSRKKYRHYEPVTEKIRERIKIQEKVKELQEIIKHTDFLKLSMEQLDSIMSIIKERG